MSDERNKNKEYLTMKEAAQIARLSYTKLRSLIKSGELRHLRPTWKVVIDRDDLDAFMQSRANATKVG